MKIVIQCAASKDPAAGTMRTRDGRPVLFVAKPELAEPTANCAYARPDDRAENGQRWRDLVLEYNRAPGDNPLGLLPAWQLYQRSVYAALVQRYDTDKVYILSAGWGLLRADFLTPAYDITFSSQADACKRRRKRDAYDDLNMLEEVDDAPVVFFGGKDYLQLFVRLTESYVGPRIAIFNSLSQPQVQGVQFVRYQTRTRTNWHYKAVRALLSGELFAAGCRLWGIAATEKASARNRRVSQGRAQRSRSVINTY